ncbi:MAG: amino acid ABC transporter permease [Clostridia bacterium]|nr:amino acid ABC transporter permease [Clostridia bacterium]
MNIVLLSGFQSWLNNLKDTFYLNFIADDRYMYFLNGLGTTLEVTFFACILGIFLGAVIAIIRTTHDKLVPDLGKCASKYILKVLNFLANVYLTIIRGTPVVVQLMICYFVIFATSKSKVMIAVLAFGINSGAYVAEIIRAGIMSIDNGQLEAGRSLGFNYIQTMWYIIFPQAFKNILPSLANEFIVLLKETSVAGYVGLQDLTKAGDIVRGRTFSAFMPLLAVAIIYLIVVMFFTRLVATLERRLKNSER